MSALGAVRDERGRVSSRVLYLKRPLSRGSRTDEARPADAHSSESVIMSSQEMHSGWDAGADVQGGAQVGQQHTQGQQPNLGGDGAPFGFSGDFSHQNHQQMQQQQQQQQQMAVAAAAAAAAGGGLGGNNGNGTGNGPGGQGQDGFFNGMHMAAMNMNMGMGMGMGMNYAAAAAAAAGQRQLGFPGVGGVGVGGWPFRPELGLAAYQQANMAAMGGAGGQNNGMAGMAQMAQMAQMASMGGGGAMSGMYPPMNPGGLSLVSSVHANSTEPVNFPFPVLSGLGGGFPMGYGFPPPFYPGMQGPGMGGWPGMAGAGSQFQQNMEAALQTQTTMPTSILKSDQGGNNNGNNNSGNNKSNGSQEGSAPSRPRRGRPPKGSEGGSSRKAKHRRKGGDGEEDEEEDQDEDGGEGGEGAGGSGPGKGEPRTLLKKAGSRFYCDFDGCGRSYSTRLVFGKFRELEQLGGATHPSLFSGHLARHKRGHNLDFRFSCSFEGCLAKFTRRDSARSHEKTHLRGYPPEDVEAYLQQQRLQDSKDDRSDN